MSNNYCFQTNVDCQCQCFLNFLFYFVPGFFFKDVLSSCFSWHCENVTHFRCNAASLIAVKSSLTADRMWNYRRKILTYMQGNFSLVSICEMFEFARGRAIWIPLGSCIQTNTLRTIFNIIAIRRKRNQLLAGYLCFVECT